MKIAVCADLHLNNNSYGKLFADGLPLKIHDNITALRFFVTECVHHMVDRVVIAGDVYDNQGPNSKVRRLFNECIQELARNNIDVSIMSGNHDFCMEHHALEPVKNWTKKIKIIDSLSSEVVDDIVIAYVPHTKDIENKKNSFKDVVEKLKSSANKNSGKRILLFGHMSVCGAMNNDFFAHFNTKDPSVADLEAIGSEACFLGHFHKRQKLSEKQNIFYVGSLERQSFSERNQQKGFCIYDTCSKEIEWVDYEARKMVEISAPRFEDLLDEIDKVDIRDAIVKIKITGSEEDYARIQQRFSEISDLIANKKAMFFCGLERPRMQKNDEGSDVEIEQTDDVDIYRIIEEEIRNRSSEHTEEEIQARIEFLQQIKKEVDTDVRLSSKVDLTGKRTIKFKWAEYHNFCRFGTENNILDLEKLFSGSGGIASVIGMVDLDEEEANGAGKSSLLEGIAYALYERIPRLCSVKERKKVTTTEIIRTDDMGNYACNESYVKLCMDVDGDEWIVKRGRKLNKSKTDHTAILELTRNGEPFHSLKNKEPNQAIIDLIGIDFEPFCNSVFFAQKDSSKMFTSTPGSRIDTILNVLGVLRQITVALKIIREDKKKNNKEEMIKLEGKLSVLKSSVPYDMDKIEWEIKEKESEFLCLSNKIAGRKAVEEELVKKKDALIENKENEVAKESALIVKIEFLQTEKHQEKESLLKDIANVQSLINEEEKKNAEFERQKEILKKEYASLDNSIKGVEIAVCQKSFDDIQKHKVSLTEKESEKEKIITEKERVVSKKNILEMSLQDKKAKLNNIFETIRAAEHELDSVDKKILETDIDLRKKQLKEITSLREEIKELQKKKNDLIQKITDLKLSNAENKNSIANIDKSIGKYNEIISSGSLHCPYCDSEQKEDELHSKIERLNSDKKDIQNKSDLVSKKILSLQIEEDKTIVLINEKQSVVDKETAITLLISSYESAIEKRSAIEDKINSIDSYDFSRSENVKHNISAIRDLLIKDAESIKNNKELIELNDKIKELNDRIIEIDKEIADLKNKIKNESSLITTIENYKNTLVKMEEAKVRAKNLQESYNKAKGLSIAVLNDKISTINIQISGIDNKYQNQFQEMKDSYVILIKSIEGIKVSLNENIENTNFVKKEINVLQDEKQKVETSIRDFKNIILAIQENNKKIKETQDLWDKESSLQLRISLLEDLFGSDGIKSKIAEVYLPVFNKHLSDFMSILTGGRLSVNMNKATMEPIIRGGSSSNYDMLSGGEQDVIRLAANLSLGMVSLGSSKSLPETLFLDEIFGSLAPAMQDRVFLLLKHLTSYFKRIMVVTHNPSLQERFSRFVRVRKNMGVSSIEILGV